MAEPPASVTQEFRAITADFQFEQQRPHLGPPVPIPAVRQGLGSKPAPEKIVDERAEKKTAASRSAPRATKRVVRAASRPVARKTRAKVVKVSSHTGAGRHRAAPKPRHKVVQHRKAKQVRKVVHKRPVIRKVARKAPAARGGMSRVIAFARANVGHSYGGNWDCSGFVKQAYAKAGIRLPHQSGAIAARAYTISRSAARPGDLVVGPGHVGIYMGKGMMIDAGNSRVGVSYRKMYRGLWIERLR